jgi:hypothetical protein
LNKPRYTILITVLSILAVLLAHASSVVLGTSSIDIIGPENKPYGLSYEEHVKNFWKWVLSIPADKGLWDTADKGENCHVGQSPNSPIFYITGNDGGRSTRTCHVPAGKALFIPVSPMEASDKESGNAGKSVEYLTKVAKDDQDSIKSLYLRIDDKIYHLTDLAKYRIHTGAFEVYFPRNAIMGVSTEGSAKAAADGYYVITEPLTSGTHTIQYKSSLICTEALCTDPSYASDITYNIISD